MSGSQRSYGPVGPVGDATFASLTSMSCVPARRFVGFGFNSVTSECDPTAHAEVQAIRDASRRLGRSLEIVTGIRTDECEHNRSRWRPRS